MHALKTLFAAIVIVTVSACSADPAASNSAALAPAAAVPAERPTVAELQAAVRSAVPLKPKWENIHAEDARAGKGSFKLALVYNTMPSGHDEVERDTKEIAKAALAALVDAGRNPYQERLFLSVWARKPETGATGQPLVRLFGKSQYDANSDSIEYERYK